MKTPSRFQHDPIIDAEIASCTCGRMPAIIRPNGEANGAFTARSYSAWQLHRDMAESSTLRGTQYGMFEQQAELFGK